VEAGLVRLNLNGGRDNSFAPILFADGCINTIAEQTDGKPMVVGESNKSSLVF